MTIDLEGATEMDRHPVTMAELAELPEPARRYLRFIGVVGRPRDRSFRLEWMGRFRTGPDRSWMTCEATQVDASDPIARDFRMHMRFGGIVPVVAHDTYFEGRGHMSAKAFGLLTVADARGKELDEGELVTWLNDAILFAPSMLLRPEVAWSFVHENAFDVVLIDHDTTVKGRVFVSGRGAPIDFSTTDRTIVEGKKRNAARWSTPIDGWQDLGGRCIPTGARAMWHLPGGSFAYAEFRPKPGTVAFDETLSPEETSTHRDVGLTAVSGTPAKSDHEPVSEVVR